MSATVPSQNDPERTDPASLLRTGIAVSADGGRTRAVVELHGELCAHTATELRHELEQLVDDGIALVSIQLRDLRLCTSHGLDVFDDVHRLLSERDGGSLRLDLTGAPEIVRDVVRLIRHRDPSFAPPLVEATPAPDATAPADEPPGEATPGGA